MRGLFLIALFIIRLSISEPGILVYSFNGGVWELEKCTQKDFKPPTSIRFYWCDLNGNCGNVANMEWIVT